MKTHYKYIIIGGGTTAGYAAREFADQGVGKGDLCIISAETILPMDRPPLSKAYLSGSMGKEELPINPKEFYEQHGIEVLLGTCVKKVDLKKLSLDLDNGETFTCEKLLIATGSSLNHLGLQGSEMKNIFYLRNSVQSDKIRNAASKGAKALIIGGQYIGTEVAASLCMRGADVTMVFPESRLLSRFATEEISYFFDKYYRNKGIKMISNEKVFKFNGNGKVQGIVTTSGKEVGADLVVAGIGVRPNVSIFKNSGLNINSAIQVNEYCETNIPNVYAAGDVCEFPDLIFGGTRHVEHWENAMEQGQIAARVMSGKREAYVFLPYFFSDIFDLSYEFFGDSRGADDIVDRGDFSTGDFSTWWKKDGRLIAAFIMGTRPDEERQKAREWIKNKTKVDM